MWNLLAAAAHSQSVAEKIVEKYTLGSGEREREGGGLSRGGAAGDVTLIDEPFSVFSPIRKRGRREGEGGIDALLGCSLPFPGY